MDQNNLRAQRIADKLKQLEIRVQQKVDKLGYQTQYEELKKLGFSDIKFILRALKKCKGNLNEAIQLLQTFAEEAKKMPENKADTSSGEQRTNEKKWIKYLKKNQDSQKEKSTDDILSQETPQGQTKEEIKFKQMQDQQPKEILKNQQEETKVCENDSKPHEKKWMKYLKKRDDERSPEEYRKRERKCKRDFKKIEGENDFIHPKDEIPHKHHKDLHEKKWQKYLKKRDENQAEDSELIFKNDEQTQFEERNKHLKQRKFERMNELFPQFSQFNSEMKRLGFEDDKKNFNSLKKHSGNQEKAKAHLIRKKILEELELCKTLSKGQFQRVYLDCNNCFYLETSFLKKAIKGNFQAIEERIAILMKIFQNNYGNVEIILVFDDSKLLKDQNASKLFYSNDFSIITGKPDFESADDAMVALAGTENEESFQKTLFVTSDRMLQARLVEQNAKHIMASKNFFQIMKEEVVGNKDYAAIIDV